MKTKKYYRQFKCKKCGKQLTKGEFDAGMNFFETGLTIAFYTCYECGYTDSVKDKKAIKKRDKFLLNPFRGVETYFIIFSIAIVICIITAIVTFV